MEGAEPWLCTLGGLCPCCWHGCAPLGLCPWCWHELGLGAVLGLLSGRWH